MLSRDVEDRAGAGDVVALGVCASVAGRGVACSPGHGCPAALTGRSPRPRSADRRPRAGVHAIPPLRVRGHPGHPAARRALAGCRNDAGDTWGHSGSTQGRSGLGRGGVVAAACGGRVPGRRRVGPGRGGAGTGSGGVEVRGASRHPEAGRVSIVPADDAGRAALAEGGRAAESGTLTSVTVADAQGKAIAGSKDSTGAWTSSQGLRPDTAYTVTARPSAWTARLRR